MGCDYSDFEALLESLQDFEKNIDEFIEGCTKALAARLLETVIRRTPIGIYPADSGKKDGTLRRGWTGNTNSNAAAYVSSLAVNKVGNAYVIEIVNPVDYASYVEFGQKTRGGGGWVEGRFMLTVSEEEINASAPTILENKIKNELGRVFK